MYRVAHVLSRTGIYINSQANFQWWKTVWKTTTVNHEATRVGWGKTLTGSSRFKLSYFLFCQPMQGTREGLLFILLSFSPWLIKMLTQSSILGQTFRYKISTLTLCHTLPLFPEAALISISPSSLLACKASVALSGSPTIKQPGECGMSSSSMSAALTETSLATDAAGGPFFPHAQQPLQPLQRWEYSHVSQLTVTASSALKRSCVKCK